MNRDELRTIVRDAIREALEPVRKQLDDLIGEQRATLQAAELAAVAAERAANQAIEFATSIDQLSAGLDGLTGRVVALENCRRQNGNRPEGIPR